MTRSALLIGHSPAIRRDIRTFSLAPFTLAAYLKSKSSITEGWSIDVRDYPGYVSSETIAADVARVGPTLVGLSWYIWNATEMDELAALIKAINPRTVVVAGGPQVSDQREAEILLSNNAAVDYVIRGEGEGSLEEFLAHFDAIQAGEFELGGLTRRRHGTVVSFPIDRDWFDLSTGVSPYVSGEIDLSNGEERRYAYVEGSRGCNKRCKYCGWGTRVKQRFYPTEYVKAELTTLIRSGVGTIFVCDADFFQDAIRAKELLSHAIAEGYRNAFYLEGMPYNIDDEIASMLAQLGRVKISFGLQSHDHAVLRLVNRTINTEQFSSKIRLLKLVAPNVSANFGIIYGLPGQTLQSYLDTLEFALSLNADAFTLNRLVLLPGTELHVNRGQLGLEVEDGRLVATPSLGRHEMTYVARISMFLRVLYSFSFLRDALLSAGGRALTRRPRITFVEELFAFASERGLFADASDWPDAVCVEQKDNEARASLLKRMSRPREAAGLFETIAEFAGDRLSATERQQFDEAVAIYRKLHEKLGNIDLMYSEGDVGANSATRVIGREQLARFLPATDWYL